MTLRYRRPVPARAYQKPDDIVVKLSTEALPGLRKVMSHALRKVRACVNKREIVACIDANDLVRAARCVDLDGVKAAFEEAFKPVAALFHEAARVGADQIRQIVRNRIRKDAVTDEDPDEGEFDYRDAAAIALLLTWQTSFVDGLNREIRQAIYNAIFGGIQAGKSANEIAVEIEQGIALAERQANAVVSYRRALEDPSQNALARALRDTSADGEVKTSVETGVALSPEKIDALVEAYVERATEARAETIAESAANKAANLGLQAAYRQAVARGTLPDESVRQFWQLCLDEKTCPVCIELAVVNIDGVPINSSFKCSAGEFDPGDVHPNCRCSVEIRTNLNLVATTGAAIAESML